MAGVFTKDGKEKIITGDDIPEEFLENAKRIGAQAIKCLPVMKTSNGKPVSQVLVRTDIGCSDSQLHDVNTNWDPSKRTFFLNEIEPSSTTYFVRCLKFDCMPMYGELYAKLAREIYRRQGPRKSMKKAVKGGKVTKAKTSMKSAMKVMKRAMKAKTK